MRRHSRGARALIERAFEREGRPAPDADLVTERLTVFLEAYGADIARHSRPFEGVEAMLDSLAEAGARLGAQVAHHPHHLGRLDQ